MLVSIPCYRWEGKIRWKGWGRQEGERAEEQGKPKKTEKTNNVTKRQNRRKEEQKQFLFVFFRYSDSEISNLYSRSFSPSATAHTRISSWSPTRSNPSILGGENSIPWIGKVRERSGHSGTLAAGGHSGLGFYVLLVSLRSRNILAADKAVRTVYSTTSGFGSRSFFSIITLVQLRSWGPTSPMIDISGVLSLLFGHDIMQIL